MEINGVITNTTLTPKAFAIECELVYEGNAAKTACRGKRPVPAGRTSAPFSVKSPANLHAQWI